MRLLAVRRKNISRGLKVTLAYSSFLKPRSSVRKKFKPQAFASPVVDESWLVLHHSL